MVVNVLVEISSKNIDKTFDYNVPLVLQDKIDIGKRVTVPFGRQVLEGFVLGFVDNNYGDLKDVIGVVDEDIVLTKELLELGKYISKMTLSTLISSYQVMLPKALKAKNGTNINKKMVKYIILDKENIDIKLNSKQEEIISLVRDNKVLKSELNKISLSSVNTLLKKGILKEIIEEEYRLDTSSVITNKFKLTSDQERVVNDILSDKVNKVFLIHGVTGSGKTEVYMEIIDNIILEGKTAIVLVPEISLTPQIVSRFRNHFGNRIAILHSRLSEGEKYDEYRKISRGEVDIVIGARSAIFAPLKNIGVIVIDEEHSTSYKQDSANPKYNAIDVAIERSKYHDAKVILGSATPSLETYARASKGVYKLLELKNRVNNRKLPKVEIVDLNKEKRKNSYFSEQLKLKIEERLQRKEQIILLLNRRGYASFVMCSNCGYVEKCPNCDITLTYHKSSNTLRCHYCGYGNKRIEVCPECGEKAIKELGAGTEKVEEEIAKIFNCRTVRMDYDTTSRKGAHEKIIDDFKNYKYDILLGTQMIAKGLDFDNVTLVGVINADTSLMVPNFRSSEFTFQLLSQVAGRSGRGSKEGEVVIQTFNPDHYAIKYSENNDYFGFYKEEMKIRRELSYSPYYFMVNIRIISKDYDKVKEESNKIGSFLKNKLTNSIILGPSVCSVFRVNGFYRFNIIIKYKKENNLYPSLIYLQDHYKNVNNISLDIDFNPINI